ncbi:sugar phosphate isomerase/epimerase family protein [Paenibacillus aceris]|uniref:Sugar phosphate isomerase/epimerase n=1 Tax=Paenibacillus aceris TaxID=869555 RepID=A0ABS4I3K3_9BACL|nr:sugar phosphate isomerase/epimerase [Paenibacillus aceris]MBP1965378.1 sugar phosphate isomerase/epimerase [Paenibacillus aceris]NHW36058.1 sugar phosphate isomerase/epimerase [Paenibacillus aceris]
MNNFRLDMQQSWWAMGGLGTNGKQWSTEERFEKIAEAGYTSIISWIPAKEEMDNWHRLLDKYKLGFSALAFPRTVKDIVDSLEAAAVFGRVSYINAQVMDSFVVDQEAVQLLDGILAASEQTNIPVYIETHRGTVTQDLIRTVSYCNSLPRLPLTIDLSHYVVAGEMNGTSNNAETLFDRLLKQTACIHARVSDGEKIQVDVGAEGDHPMLVHFKRWWRKAMLNWLASASSGTALPFVTELGPPGNYAMTYRDAFGREMETSDRWKQALLFKEIAERIWTEVTHEVSATNK